MTGGSHTEDLILEVFNKIKLCKIIKLIVQFYIGIRYIIKVAKREIFSIKTF